jgi:hypothetical protein
VGKTPASRWSGVKHQPGTLSPGALPGIPGGALGDCSHNHQIIQGFPSSSGKKPTLESHDPWVWKKSLPLWQKSWQTSDALGAAAAQLGPDAQAAVVELNKQAGLSHGKVTRCLGSSFGITLSRGGSVHTVLTNFISRGHFRRNRWMSVSVGRAYTGKRVGASEPTRVTD